MTPEKLLTALNDIDGQSIRDAHCEGRPAKRASSRRIAALIAAVIALTAMTVTAFAAEDIIGWFRHYFSSRSATPLTPEQIEYIEENEQIIEETQASSGYTVELKSFLTDGEMIYATIGITAPKNVNLEEINLHFAENVQILDQNGRNPFSNSFSREDDMDGLANTETFVLDFLPGSWNIGSIWTIQFNGICQEVYDRAYEQELLQTKYAGQTDVMFTPEESAHIHQYSEIAAGKWEFTIDLSTSSPQELELITEPVLVTAIVSHWMGEDHLTCDIEDGLERINLTSFILTPFGATLKFEEDSTVCSVLLECQDNYWYENRDVFAVMKDGSQVALHTNSIGTNLAAESPIILEEVDYILLADGTKLMVP